MSDNEMATGSQAQINGGMSQADVDFLMCCLRNTTGGSIQVDTQRVAQLLNYKNPRSVSNKVSTIKKKYDLPFGASSRTAEEMASIKPGKGDSSPKKASDANGDNEPAVPATPSKNRVAKPKAIPKPRAARKAPAKKPKKVVSEDEDDELTNVKDEDMEEAKQEDEDE